MGVEAVETYYSQPPLKDGIQVNNTCLHEMDIKKQTQGWGLDDPTECDSSSTDKPYKEEENPPVDANILLEDAIEWPAPKKSHNFYFVKFPSYEDSKLKTKINQLEWGVQKKIDARFQINEAISWTKMQRPMITSELKLLTIKYKRCWTLFKEEANAMETRPQASQKLHAAKSANRERADGLCSSEEELNYIISSLRYRIQHERNTLAVEKQIIREMKHLEGTREKVIANASMKNKITNEKVKFIGIDMDGTRKNKQFINARIKYLKECLKALDDQILALQEQLTATNQKKNAEYANLVELRKQQEQENADYYQNCSLLKNARDLAVKKDIASLEELSCTEVENFMCLWRSNKSFRDDYVERSSPSIDNQKLSRDGRMKNPDDKPLVSNATTTTELESVMKENIKTQRKIQIQHETLLGDTAQKDENYEIQCQSPLDK